MDPRFYRETEPFAMMSATEDARASWRSQPRRPDAAATREGAFHEQVQVPSWDSEVFSGRGRAPHVAPVWETWLSSDGPTAEEDTASSGSSASACRRYSKHDGESDSTPSSDTQTFSAEGRAQGPAAAPSNLRLVALTELAALLVCAVVATNAKVNRIVLASLDTESPDETRQNTPDCQAVVYTYCPVARREFHYRASVNACLATTLDPVVQLCARGFNRFSSRANCEHSCVFGYRPKDTCFDTPLFSGCDRQDVSETSWYFEGGRCHLWGFPAGACPSNDSAIFSTAAECASRCAGGSRHGFPPCGAPRPTACGRNQLRFPFFAHFSVAEGRMRCLRASAVLDVGHRCLAGDNRFASLADCTEACAKTTTR